MDGSGATASCNVTVSRKQVSVSYIELSESEVNLEIGDTHVLFVTIHPDEADNKSVMWECSNPEVVTVDSEGNLTAIGEGIAKITATAMDGSGANDYCYITVIKHSGVDVVNSDSIEIVVAGSEVVINGAADGTLVSLISIDGKVISTTVSNGSEIRMNLEIGKTYILNVGNISKKIMTH